MAPPTGPRRAARPLAVATVLLLGLGLLGCSSSSDDDAGAGTTTSAGATDTTEAPGGTDTTGPSDSTDSGSRPTTNPSTLPSFESTCAALVETYGLDALQPQNTPSWPDERMRIEIDAPREAALLTQAAAEAPADIAEKLTTMATYASWVGTTISGADSFSAAVDLLGAYPDRVGVSLAVAGVDTWRKANCPE